MKVRSLIAVSFLSLGLCAASFAQDKAASNGDYQLKFDSLKMIGSNDRSGDQLYMTVTEQLSGKYQALPRTNFLKQTHIKDAEGKDVYRLVVPVGPVMGPGSVSFQRVCLTEQAENGCFNNITGIDKKPEVINLQKPEAGHYHMYYIQLWDKDYVTPDDLIGTVQVWIGEGDQGRVNWLFSNGVYHVGLTSGEVILGGGSQGEYKASFSLTPKP